MVSKGLMRWVCFDGEPVAVAINCKRPGHTRGESGAGTRIACSSTKIFAQGPSPRSSALDLIPKNDNLILVIPTNRVNCASRGRRTRATPHFPSAPARRIRLHPPPDATSSCAFPRTLLFDVSGIWITGRRRRDVDTRSRKAAPRISKFRRLHPNRKQTHSTDAPQARRKHGLGRHGADPDRLWEEMANHRP